MTTPKLGRLEKVSIDAAWKHEARDFTPWLSQEENLSLLAETLGLIDLEFEETEHQVGDFRLDILCEDHEGKVIIENQFGKTDHYHLGQILTYAAGVGTKKVIWLAETFREEHIGALSFLNEHTTSDLSFFGVEIELWRIGESAIAPSFKVVAKPNEWTRAAHRAAASAGAMSPTKQRQLAFWTAWRASLEEKGSAVKPQRAAPQHWINIKLGRLGAHLAATVNTKEDRIAVEVFINHRNSKAWFRALEARKASIEANLGEALEWMELPDAHACRILLPRSNSPLASDASWSAYFAWLEQAVSRMAAVFSPLIQDRSICPGADESVPTASAV
jgi:hypothetical protein